MPASLTLVAILALSAAPPEPPQPGPSADSFQPDPAWKPFGRSLWFDPKGKRLILRARVVLREGPLEHLLCLTGTKEHEAILATDAVPRQIHAGLLLTGAAPGHPVRFQPQFAPPTGTPIAIELEWVEAGKTRRADARQWVKGERNGKTLDQDWVFAGSELFQDPETKTPVYAADGGDLITVANFSSAILDLPFASASQDAERVFVANTPRLPPRGTTVTMSLRPRPPSAPPKR
jgi:hypothetical protein